MWVGDIDQDLALYKRLAKMVEIDFQAIEKPDALCSWECVLYFTAQMRHTNLLRNN